jgi:hypothetical protein
MATAAIQRPSRKWLATQVTAFAALLTAYVTAGSWNTTLSISLIGLATQAIVGYLLPNAEGASSSASDSGANAKVRQRQTSNAAGPYGALTASYLATRGGRVKAR